MLEKLLLPFTTSSAAGVATRDIIQLILAVIAVLGTLGLLAPDQAEALVKQVPQLVTGLAAVGWIGVSIYRTLFKSSSDKAAGVAKTVDAEIPASLPVKIDTADPGVGPIIVDTSGRKVSG